MKSLSKKWFLFSFIALTGIILINTQCYADIDRTVEKTFKVNPGGTLTIDSDRGAITVSTKETDMVTIEVEQIADASSEKAAKSIFEEFKLDFTQDGNNIVVTGKQEESGLGLFNNSNKLRVRFVATVPEKFNLDLKTAGGSIIVDDLDGKLMARTTGGSLDFGHISGTVDAKTAGGSIKLKGAGDDVTVKTAGGSISMGSVNGNAQAQTSGGSIRVGEVSGTLEAHTAGGSISIEGVAGTVDAKTSGGSIRAALTEQPKEECRLITSAGNISVSLPDRISVNIKARTFGGKVSTDLPITVKGELSKSQIQGALNGGGPTLLLETSGGNISISKGREVL